MREIVLTQNIQNQHHPGKYQGVSWNKSARKFRVQIGIDGKLIHLGSFLNQVDAALAYNKAATTYYGKYASLNSV